VNNHAPKKELKAKNALNSLHLTVITVKCKQQTTIHAIGVYCCLLFFCNAFGLAFGLAFGGVLRLAFGLAVGLAIAFGGVLRLNQERGIYRV